MGLNQAYQEPNPPHQEPNSNKAPNFLQNPNQETKKDTNFNEITKWVPQF